MGKWIDLTHHRFGRLFVIKKADKPLNVKNKLRYWLCECDCTNKIVVPTSRLLNKQTQSCGCLFMDSLKERHLHHRKWLYDTGQIIFNDKLNIILTDKIYDKRKKYKYSCHKCGYTEGLITESDIINTNAGCPCCIGRVVVEGINDIPTTASWMVKYFLGGYKEAKLYTRSSDKKIFPICPNLPNLFKYKK